MGYPVGANMGGAGEAEGKVRNNTGEKYWVF